MMILRNYKSTHTINNEMKKSTFAESNEIKNENFQRSKKVYKHNTIAMKYKMHHQNSKNWTCSLKHRTSSSQKTQPSKIG